MIYSINKIVKLNIIIIIRKQVRHSRLSSESKHNILVTGISENNAYILSMSILKLLRHQNIRIDLRFLQEKWVESRGVSKRFKTSVSTYTAKYT